jgi:hypothetical protein
MLEPPFGSVRWKEDTPDRAANDVLPVIAGAAGSSTSVSLPVVGQDLLASPADVATVFLQAGQHDLVTFVHMGAAKAGNVASAGVMFVCALGGSIRGDQKKRNQAKKSGHLLRLDVRPSMQAEAF